MNKRQIARQLLGFTDEAEPERDPTRIFKLPVALTVDPADIERNIAEAAKENTAMLETATTVTQQFRASLEKHDAELGDAIDRLKGQQEEANAEHAAQLQRLKDEIATRTAVHAEFTDDINERIADTERTRRGIQAALETTAPGYVPPPPAIPAPPADAPATISAAAVEAAEKEANAKRRSAAE